MASLIGISGRLGRQEKGEEKRGSKFDASPVTPLHPGQRVNLLHPVHPLG